MPPKLWSQYLKGLAIELSVLYSLYRSIFQPDFFLMMEKGKGTGGVLGDLDSGIKIYIHDGSQRRLGQTGGAGSGGGGVDIWSGMTL